MSRHAKVRALSWLEELRLFRTTLGNYADGAMAMQRAYGDAVRIRLPGPGIHLFHPRHVDHVL